MRIDWSQTRVRVSPILGRVRCEPGWRLEKIGDQAVPDFDLWFVWAGRGEMQTDEGNVHLRPGVCIWMRPSGFYLADQDPDDRLGVTFIHFDLLNDAGQIRSWTDPTPPAIHDVTDIPFADATMRRVVQIMRFIPQRPAGQAAHLQRAADMLLTGLLIDLDDASDRSMLTPAGGTELHHRKLVMEIASQISERPNEPASVAQLAEQAGYSADHFSRVFKSVLGQSPQSYAVQARINRACQLLTESTMGIGQIAAALGYDDIYFFSRQFRRKMNCSPSEYRKRGRGESESIKSSALY